MFLYCFGKQLDFFFVLENNFKDLDPSYKMDGENPIIWQNSNRLF